MLMALSLTAAPTIISVRETPGGRIGGDGKELWPANAFPSAASSLCGLLISASCGEEPPLGSLALFSSAWGTSAFILHPLVG